MHVDASPQHPLLVCCLSGETLAHSLLIHLGDSWELVVGEFPAEERLAGAPSVVALLSEGCLDAPEFVFSLRCVLAYNTPRVLVHAAESCDFDMVMPRAGSAAHDIQSLYNKVSHRRRRRSCRGPGSLRGP
jgi:hypothetical protein